MIFNSEQTKYLPWDQNQRLAVAGIEVISELRRIEKDPEYIEWAMKGLGTTYDYLSRKVGMPADEIALIVVSSAVVLSTMDLN